MAQETPYRKLPQQARGQQRIARLLDAAECVFAAVGYDAATTNAIAAQANTSIGSLYQFFPNKEALLTALAGRYLAELRDTLDQTLTPETTELPLADFLDCILGALGSFLGEHTSFRPLFISARHPGHTKDEVANAAYELRQEVVLRIDGLLALRAPSLAEADRLLYAQVCVDTVRGLLPLLQATPPSRRPRVIAEMKRLLLAYLAPVIG